MAYTTIPADLTTTTDPIFAHSKERFQQVIDHLKGHPTCNEKELPGLGKLLDDYCRPDVDVSNESYLRRLICVFKDSKTDGTYSKVLSKYNDDEKTRISSFVNGRPAEDCSKGFHMGLSLGAREELGHLVPFSIKLLDNVANHVRSALLRTFTTFRVYNDIAHKHRVDTYVDEEFQNWGRTVQNTPKFTCVPQTTYGVQEIVKFAKKNNMNVRASGYRHSWAPLFGRNGQILISTIDLQRAEVIPNLESLLPGLYPADTDLTSIKFVGEVKPGQKRLVRVGTGVTNSSFRVWCNTQKDASHLSTLPFNVILVEVTLGGTNATICHGAGRAHPTLSDLVYGIEYVDADGNLQKLDRTNPRFMSVASGSFGLLGVVTHITLEVDAMSYAVLTPQKLPMMKAIPPPPGMKLEDIPEPLRISMTPEERDSAQAAFEKHARDDYYAEWFWFPYTSSVWVNCWNTVDDSTGSIDYPSHLGVFSQFIQTVAIQIIQVSEALINLQKLLPFVQATLISKLGLDVMPDSLTNPKDKIKTKLPDALHFRRAVQNVRVRDMELEMPLMPKTGTLAEANFDSEIDFSLIQQAWWDAVSTAYKHTTVCPQRMPLEMRITGPSNVLLAPFKGHNLGTCAIEILTLDVMKGVWTDYAQEVLDHWMELKDRQGNYLPSRLHWAKEWTPFRVRGRPILEYMKESYKHELVEFKTILREIVESKGGNFDETRKRFSNELFDVLLYAEPEGVVRGKPMVVVGGSAVKSPRAEVAEVTASLGGLHA